MKMSLKKSEHGIAHLALILVIVVGIIGAAGFLVYKKQSTPNSASLEADAAGAYSSVCGRGFNLRHTQNGNGFRLMNYKNPNTGKGCALTINNNWGVRANLSVEAGRSYYSAGKGGFTSYGKDSGSYRYYAGPIYYNHAKGITVIGKKNGAQAHWTLTSN